MIETVKGVTEASAIAAVAGTAALFPGTNDLRTDMKIPAGSGRAGVTTALQLIVMAARMHGKAVFAGVYNRLNAEEGCHAACRQGQVFGFYGKTHIHPHNI